MKKKILNTLLAGAAIATMGSMSAQAGTLDAVAGDVVFLFNGLDAAQSSYDTSGIGDGDTLCSTVAECDAASAPTNAPGANSSNDTWGITLVSAIKEQGFGGATLWSDNIDSDILLTYFHGFEDTQVDRLGATSTNIFSIGGNVDIYRIDQAILDGLDLSNQASFEASIAALSTYLELSFDPGCSASVAAATLCGNFDLDNLEGKSNGFAHATGGSALSKYPNLFQFEQSVEPCEVNVNCPAGTSFNVVVRSGSALTTALPEPGTLGLLGLGLVGLGLAGRRRKA